MSFPHRHSAHCESGATQALMLQQGVELSEALLFGIGSGIFFGYMPFVQVDHLPLTTYRIMPGGIFKRAANRLGVKVKRHRYLSEANAMRELDAMLGRGKAVGAQVGVYWLPYFPPRLRFHFNAHNIVIFGKEGEEYLISDPVLDEPVRCAAKDLQKARFARGPLAPHGALYHLCGTPDLARLRPAAVAGIRESCNKMLRIPIPVFGVRGIRYLADKLPEWPRRYGSRAANLHLGQVIRMQEEIGTGGAGFRYVYAAFLQEAATLLERPDLLSLSEELTQVGDDWRHFALGGARIVKERTGSENIWPQLGEILRTCATREESIFRRLDTIVREL